MRIAMWSGPRNLSTAMMYAFAQRAECVAVDEPFYAAYLAATGLDHPMRAEVLAAQPTDPAAVAAQLSAPLALLVIGGMLASLPASGRIGAVGLIVGGKLVLHPLAVGLGAALMPGLSAQMAAGGILFAAMPMITIFPLLAARAGQGQLAAFGLLVATLGSFASLPLVIHLLGLAQP